MLISGESLDVWAVEPRSVVVDVFLNCFCLGAVIHLRLVHFCMVYLCYWEFEQLFVTCESALRGSMLLFVAKELVLWFAAGCGIWNCLTVCVAVCFTISHAFHCCDARVFIVRDIAGDVLGCLWIGSLSSIGLKSVFFCVCGELVCRDWYSCFPACHPCVVKLQKCISLILSY